ncbi:hypothetical protein BDZ94DRAFT_577573 [Collybia nuda]|uniref:Lysine-specific metallo-endopeptidase domain-containing protein n=1 Tax=Collybia nuda TaxID=64659 RepID=A0A9P5YA27_9AGAR|nr:hypothetical protein BDZ94DRAFT_577573 [Collybia nuda]
MLITLIHSTTLRVALASLVLGLVASAAPALSVTISGPDVVSDVKNLRLKVTVTNTGQEALKLINEPGSPLITSPTDSFLITGPTKVNPTFAGISVKYAGVDMVAANGSSNTFTMLDVGKSITVTHNLSKRYNFKDSGPGKYTFDTAGLFYYVDNDKRAVSIKAATKSHQLVLQGKLSAPNRRSVERKFATFDNCTAVEQTDINSAVTNARAYVADAITFLTAHTNTTTRMTTWFGVFREHRRLFVLSNFNSLTTRGDEFSGWNYDCSQQDCVPGSYAHVHHLDFAEVHLCERFWTAPATGTDSKAGTLVHEGTHFAVTANTEDLANGKPDCVDLAKRRPGKAARNADSYQYFAENNPPL